MDKQAGYNSPRVADGGCRLKRKVRPKLRNEINPEEYNHAGDYYQKYDIRLVTVV